MGSLVSDIPFSEVTATLEDLGHAGLTRYDLKLLRRANKDLVENVVKSIREAAFLEQVANIELDARHTFEITRGDPVSIFATDENFRRYVLHKNSCEQDACAMRAHRLRRPTDDAHIIDELREDRYRHEDAQIHIGRFLMALAEIQRKRDTYRAVDIDKGPIICYLDCPELHWMSVAVARGTESQEAWRLTRDTATSGFGAPIRGAGTYLITH